MNSDLNNGNVVNDITIGGGILEKRKNRKIDKQKEKEEKISNIMRAFGGSNYK